MAHLGDEDVLGLDVPVEAVVQVAEVDRLQCLPHDALQHIYYIPFYYYTCKIIFTAAKSPQKVSHRHDI